MYQGSLQPADTIELSPQHGRSSGYGQQTRFLTAFVLRLGGVIEWKEATWLQRLWKLLLGCTVITIVTLNIGFTIVVFVDDEIVTNNKHPSSIEWQDWLTMLESSTLAGGLLIHWLYASILLRAQGLHGARIVIYKTLFFLAVSISASYVLATIALNRGLANSLTISSLCLPPFYGVTFFWFETFSIPSVLATSVLLQADLARLTALMLEGHDIETIKVNNWASGMQAEVRLLKERWSRFIMAHILLFGIPIFDSFVRCYGTDQVFDKIPGSPLHAMFLLIHIGPVSWYNDFVREQADRADDTERFRVFMQNRFYFPIFGLQFSKLQFKAVAMSMAVATARELFNFIGSHIT